MVRALQLVYRISTDTLHHPKETVRRFSMLKMGAGFEDFTNCSGYRQRKWMEESGKIFLEN
jgi:hypothetical protein